MTSVNQPEWIELVVGDELSDVKASAREILAKKGIDVDSLSSDQVRVDVGLDADRKSLYRIKVRPTVLSLLPE